MKATPLTPEAQMLYNSVVEQAYFRVLKKAKQMLATIEQEELRFTLERSDKGETKGDMIIHEIISPVLYLRLECHTDNVMAIHFGIEPVNQLGQLSDLTSMFLRKLYEYTGQESTGANIEKCVRTDWFINLCSEMYEYIEVRNKYHTFKQIKYRDASTRKKQILSIA